MKSFAILMATACGLWLSLSSCDNSTAASAGPLPYLGFHDVDENTGDTTYHQIRDFTFVDQDSQLITNDYFAGKAYVADFFFTSCPTICPKVKQQMLRVYKKYEGDDRIALLSHTIDVKRDTVAKLKRYAQGLGADSPQWRFVTGDKKEIFAITYDYISTALDAPDVPGGFDHSGYLLLIDENRHLRAFANGTDPEDVTQFLDQIDLLLAEMEE
jgi:protein SCO1/2